MARRVQVRLAAPAAEVRDCVDRVVGRSGSMSMVDVEVRPGGDEASMVTLASRLALRVPDFGWFVRILAWVAARRELADLAGRLRAEVEGTAPPPVRRASSVPFGAEQAACLATAAVVRAVANFRGALLTPDSDAVTRSFGRSDQDLGFALALTRAGCWWRWWRRCSPTGTGGVGGCGRITSRTRGWRCFGVLRRGCRGWWGARRGPAGGDAGAAAGLTLGALDTELFPTEVRGTSNGFLLVCGVAGSATGLLAATRLSGTVGGWLGRSRCVGWRRCSLP